MVKLEHQGSAGTSSSTPSCRLTPGRDSQERYWEGDSLDQHTEGHIMKRKVVCSLESDRTGFSYEPLHRSALLALACPALGT